MTLPAMKALQSSGHLAWSSAWKAAYDRAAAAGGPARVAVFGDSIAQGFYGTTPYWSEGWVGVMTSRLAELTGVTPGTGLVPVYEYDFTADPRMAEIGTWADSATGFYAKNRRTTGGSFTFGPVDCDSFRIMYLTTSFGGAWTATVDAGTPVALTSDGADGVHFVDVPAGSFGAHTLTLASTGAMYVVCVEAVVDAPDGVVVDRIAYSGLGCADLVTNSSALASYSCFVEVRPDLAIIAFGANESNLGVTKAAFKASMTTAIDLLQSQGASVLIVVDPTPNTAVGYSGWTDIRAAMFELASEKRCGIVDFETEFDGVWADNPGIYHDNVHPNALGQLEMGKAIARYVINAVAPSSVPTYDVAGLPGVALWLEAADASTRTQTGDLVDAWTDKINGYVGSASGSARPRVLTGFRNGLDVIDFDGVDDVLNFGDVLDLGTSSLTIFSVSKQKSGTSGVILGKYKSSPNDGAWIQFRNQPLLVTGYDPGTLAVQDDNENNSIVRCITSIIDRTAGTIIHRVNGVQLGGSAAFTPDNGTTRNVTHSLVMGALRNSADNGYTAGFYLNGYVVETIACKAVISGSTLDDVEEYLMAKGAIS